MAVLLKHSTYRACPYMCTCLCWQILINHVQPQCRDCVSRRVVNTTLESLVLFIKLTEGKIVVAWCLSCWHRNSVLRLQHCCIGVCRLCGSLIKPVFLFFFNLCAYRLVVKGQGHFGTSPPNMTATVARPLTEVFVKWWFQRGVCASTKRLILLLICCMQMTTIPGNAAASAQS